MNQNGHFRNRGKWFARLDKALPVIFFLFVFFLYFSTLSDPYFTDEQDVIFGGYSVAKGRDIYQCFLTQHMPFSYYFAAPPALLGARTIHQFRMITYLMLSLVWVLVFLRHRGSFPLFSLFAMPLLCLAVLKTIALGTSMIAEQWEGIGLMMIMLELIRYPEEGHITLPCAGMVSLGIVLSFGTVFVAAYPLMILFLGMVAVQLGLIRKAKATDMRSHPVRLFLREDLRLAGICLAPFLVLLAWYAISGNVQNALDGAYGVNVRYYSIYTGGFGSDPLAVVWETLASYRAYLWKTAMSFPSNPGRGLLVLIQTAGLIGYCIRQGRKSIPVGIALFLTAVYAGLREYEGFHGIPYLILTASILALCAGDLSEALYRRVRWAAWAVDGLACAALLTSFIIWGGYNLLYPQILQNRTLRSEARILDLLTEPGDELHICDTSVFDSDLMDLNLIPQDACYAASVPWYYDMWKDRVMAAIRALPPVVMYKPGEVTWGVMTQEHAVEYNAYVRDHYTWLPQSENIWVSHAFLPEAQRRLAENGYGDYFITNCTEITTNRPVKYYPGQNVQYAFTADAARLTAVRFCAACFYRRSDPTLRIQIRAAESGQVIAEEKMTGDMIADTFFSRCPMQAKLSPGEAYVLDITVERIGGKGDMEFYFTPEGELATAIEYAVPDQDFDQL